MKQFAALVLVLCTLSICLFGCTSDKGSTETHAHSHENSPSAPQATENGTIITAHFVGKVIEVYESGYLLKVTDTGDWDCKVGALVAVDAEIGETPEFSVGDHLKVTVDITEPLRSPLMVNEAVSIEKVDT